MRRFQSKLRPALQQFPRTSFSLLESDLICYFSSVSWNPGSTTEPTQNWQSKAHPKPCTRTPALRFSHARNGQSLQNFNTFVDLGSHELSSRQRKLQERSQLEDAFESAETTEEMLEAFEKMQASFDEMGLGLACLKLGLKLDQEGEDPEKAFSSVGYDQFQYDHWKELDYDQFQYC